MTPDVTPTPLSPNIRGTSITVRFDRVVDGDTIRVFLPGQTKSESLRILSLDTEESSPVSSKPLTPWGKAAKAFAKSFFANTTHVVLEFPDRTPFPQALEKHRGNFGRLLVFVHKHNVDFSEVMIRLGYSPYYTKYGHASFASHRARYMRAEVHAQELGIGVWDQLTVNGAVRRNYAQLTTWWTLRAGIIDVYRKFRAIDDSLLTPRLDYDRIMAAAAKRQLATVFTEVRNERRVGSRHAVVSIGSRDKPFDIFIPDVEPDDDLSSAAAEAANNASFNESPPPPPTKSPGAMALSLLRLRYISNSEYIPRLSYCYVTGELRLYRGRPQLLVVGPEAISERPGPRSVRVVSEDAAEKPPAEAVARADAEGDAEAVEVTAAEAAEAAKQPGTGDSIGDAAFAPSSEGMSDADELAQPQPSAAVPTVSARIVAALPDPKGRDAGNEVVTLAAASTRGVDGTLSLDGWRVRDSRGDSFELSGEVSVSNGVAQRKKVRVPAGKMRLNNRGDEIMLLDANGQVVHYVSYGASEVVEGEFIDFDD